MLTWVESVDSLGFARVAEALGLEPRGRNAWTPCPACDEPYRSKGDKTRGAVGCGDGRGWRCWRCGVRGGPVQLVMAQTFGAVFGAGDSRWPELRERCGELGFLAPGLPRGFVEALPPEYPDDVRRFVDACGDRVPKVRAWLRSRGIAEGEAFARGLCVAVPDRPTFVPHWASYGEYAWHESRAQWRLLVRLFDANGALRSVTARSVGQLSGNQPKTVYPRAKSVLGLVMANTLGQRLLAGTEAAVSRTRESAASLDFASGPESVGLVIVEGVPDFLSAATTWVTRPFPAVLGIISGSWRSETAARVPDGTRVLIATDPDAAGDEYAERVARSLASRCVVLRWRAEDDVSAVGLANGRVTRMDANEARRTA